MTEDQKVAMSPEELAIELMTSSYAMRGGRAEALRLLQSLRAQWGREIANIQRTAHDQSRYHMSLPCRPEYECGVREIIELAEAAGVPK
jgi:hypothetical protein